MDCQTWGSSLGHAAGVVDLSAEHEEGLAVDEEGVAAVFLDELWGFFSGDKLAERQGKKRDSSENNKRLTSRTEHVYSPRPM